MNRIVRKNGRINGILRADDMRIPKCYTDTVQNWALA